jgi:hypothetical protein
MIAATKTTRAHKPMNQACVVVSITQYAVNINTQN